MIGDCDTGNDWTDLLRLWICRMFEPAKALERLVRKSGFGDDDVAWALGLGEWTSRPAEEFDPVAVKAAVRQLQADLEARSTSLDAPTHCSNNLRQFGRILNLSHPEEQLLMLLALRGVEPVLGDAFNLMRNLRRTEYLALLSRILRLPVMMVWDALCGRSSLMRSGILRWVRAVRNGEVIELANSDIGEALLGEEFSLHRVIRTIAVPAPAPTLTYRHYPHLRETLVCLRGCLRSALRERTHGVNIYLYGDPGTGKSELTRVLAREMRATLYEISTEDRDGDPRTGVQRMESLRAAQHLLAQQRAILVFEEAEDIFGGQSIFNRSLAGERKGWMNRFFENNPIPTFWISNANRGLDPAFVRRFDLVFEVAPPPRRQRIRTYRSIVGRNVSEPVIRRLAESTSLTPAVVARAHTVASRVCQGSLSSRHEQALLHLVRDTLKAQGHQADQLGVADPIVPAVFDLSYLNSDVPLQDVVKRMDRGASCRMCLYGPPGTGKTTFGHWLARELDQPLHVKRASDILSPYVGETEQNLARIFREAREDAAILLIDEVDTFLRDRRTAVRSWEVSQVNEMLTQMERFSGIFIASTNLMRDIDQATLRRFDMKIAFDYLNGRQVCRLLERHCAELGIGRPCPVVLKEAEGIGNATPGDFANVVRQHRFRRFATPEDMLQAVIRECRMKEGGNRRPAGF